MNCMDCGDELSNLHKIIIDSVYGKQSVARNPSDVNGLSRYDINM